MALPFFKVEGLPGQIADARQHANGSIVSRAATETIGFGKFVSRGDNDAQCKLPDSSAEVTATGIGFTVREDFQNLSNAVGTYVQYDAVPIVTDGPIHVHCETAAAQHGAVFVRFTTDTDGTDLGNVRNDSDGGKAVALPGARFDKTITAAGTTVVVVKMMGPTGAQGAAGAAGPTGPTGPAGA